MQVLVLARLNHCLLLRGILNVTVSVLVASIDSLSILRAMPRLPRILMRLTSLALAAEGALLRRRVPRTAVHGARLILIHLILSVVVALLSLKALEVRILPCPNFILLEVSKHRLLRHLLRVAMDVALTLLVLFRGMIDCINIFAVLDHVIVVMLRDLLITVHYLVQFHLAVRQLTRIDFLMLRSVLDLWDLVHHVHFGAFLAVHVVVLTLAVGPTNHMRIVVLILL